MRTRKNTPASNLVNDLVACRLPMAVARAEAIRVTELARAYVAKRLTIEQLRSQLRGET
jgi:hypothetical protein